MHTCRRRISVSLTSGLLLFFLSLCACTSTPAPTSRRSDFKQQQIEAGEKLYGQYCGQCHDLFEPTLYSDKEWLQNVGDMAPRTKMTNAQVNAVATFLLSSN